MEQLDAGRPAQAAGRAGERLERLVERITGLGRGVASAANVGPLGMQPGRQGIADGLEAGL